MMNSGLKSKFSLAAPAKVNLGLKIAGKRPDGYHDLQSLMVPLSIGDRLDFEGLASPGAWEASCDHPDVPVGSGSLIEKAFRFASEALGYAGGLKVAVRKIIPMGAGLGGGSSDAAAVMRAVELFTEKRLETALNPDIAYKIGADVPFFLREGPKWVLGIGEELRAVSALPSLNLLLIHPGVGISTKWVYSQMGGIGGRAVSPSDSGEPSGFASGEPLTAPPPAASLPPAFESLTCLSGYLTNDLESVVLPQYPVIGEMKDALITLGADAALMSGSGSTVFGLYSDPNKRDEALEVLKAKHPQWWIAPASNAS